MKDDFLLIGIDGGATKVNAWSIAMEEDGQTFSLGEYKAAKSYREIPGFIDNFQPVNINIQLGEIEKDDSRPTDSEKLQGQTYIEACARVIEKIVELSGKRRILVGLGMPGIKTRDQRGISAMANGPRLIHYADELEARLSKSGIEFVHPISHIGSDAYYCGLGEEYAKEGQFKNVQNSYYLGGGTGAADALKLRGEVVPLDEVKGWFVKTWEMKSSEGLSAEKYVSSSGIQTIYAALKNTTLAKLNEAEIYPPQIRERALKGEKEAVLTFEKVSRYLAKLLYERITSLYVGWQDLFAFVNPNRPKPSSEHNFMKVLYDSIIIGQRLGDLLRDSKGDRVLWMPLFEQLATLIRGSEYLDDTAKMHYCTNGTFNIELIKISNLREAPAIGAGIDAYLSWEK